MTRTHQLQALQVSVLMFAALAATMLTQVVMQLVAQGLQDSGGVRVAPATACEVSKDGAHFTGCSSIL